MPNYALLAVAPILDAGGWALAVGARPVVVDPALAPLVAGQAKFCAFVGFARPADAGRLR
jgi:hypothetical protein